MSRQALLIALTLTSLLLLIPTTACKDLIAIEPATKGDYNLLLQTHQLIQDLQ